ncbi:NADH-quinone oxidoreductase subunit C [Streptomyces sp. NPDC058595]|uniref:NADH-quinone oxidoreductase subunit C n=1 Tax=Streptomyces sp. NPDC058595 TaxID=3346550 RepID=UPI00365658C8
MSSATSDAYDRLPDGVAEIFGPDATAERAYDLLTVDVPAATWLAALETARDELGCTYFDWLSAVDEPGTGFRVGAHVASVEPRSVRRLLVRTTVPHDAAVLPTALGVYAGAGWHERETYEMFGISFTGHPNLVHLLLPETFEGHPLRKDFVLAARVAKAWPGAKEPGEAAPGHTGPKRRQMLPPGVPDPNEWGPLKGQLPPAPTRPARTPRATTDRPPRRTRSVTEGSATQQPPPAKTPPAPWHDPRPAFEEPSQGPPPTDRPKSPPARDTGPEAGPDPERAPARKAGPEPGSAPAPQPGPAPETAPDTGAEAAPSRETESGSVPEGEPTDAPDAAPEAGRGSERAPARKAGPEPGSAPEPAPDGGDVPEHRPDGASGSDRTGGDA